MRPVLLLILALVAFTLTFVIKSELFTRQDIYLLSLIATAGCGYLIADNFFRNAKKKWHIQREIHTHEITQLHNEADILKTQIKSMPPHSEIESLQNNLAVAIADKNKFKQELSGQTLVITQKNNEIAGLRDTISQLRIGHETIQNNLIADLAAKDAVIAKHEDTLNQLQPIIAGLHDEHDKMQNTLSAKDAVIAKHEDTLMQLQPIIVGLQNEHDKLQDTLSAKDAVIAKHEDTLTQLQPIIAGLQNEHDILQDTLSAKDAVIAKHEDTLTQLQPVIAALHIEHDKLQDTLSAKDAVIAKQEDTLTQLQPVIAALHEEHDKMQNTLSSQDVIQQQLHTNLDETKATLDEYRTAIKELHGMIAEKEKSQEQFGKDITSRDTEISGLKTNLVTVQTEFDAVKEASALKDATIIQQKNTLIALNDVVEKMKQSHEDGEIQRHTELSHTRQILEDTRSKMLDLVGENEKLRVVTPADVTKNNPEPEEPSFESTRFLSIDKSIGAVKSHRTRSVEDEAEVTQSPTAPVAPAPQVSTAIPAPPPVVTMGKPNEVAPVIVAVVPVTHAIVSIPAPVVNEAVTILPSDDLKIIEGIGPKIELVLNAVGISTWHQLAYTDVEKLREVLTDAGKRFNANDPSTWPEQARLLANGEMEKFKAYTDFLISGRVPKA